MSQRRTALLSTAIATPLALAAPATLAQGMSHPCGPKSTQTPSPTPAAKKATPANVGTGQRFPCVPQDAGKCVPPKVNVETTPHRRWATIRHLQDLGAVVEAAESSSSEVTATDKE